MAKSGYQRLRTSQYSFPSQGENPQATTLNPKSPKPQEPYTIRLKLPPRLPLGLSRPMQAGIRPLFSETGDLTLQSIQDSYDLPLASPGT